jgi:hypothetical protein
MEPIMQSLFNPTTIEAAEAMLDVMGAEVVEVIIRQDQKVIWVNVNGACILRVCRIDNLTFEDLDLTKVA